MQSPCRQVPHRVHSAAPGPVNGTPAPSCLGACVVPPLSPVARYLPSNLPISTCTFCTQQAKWHSLLDGKLQFVKRKRPKKHRRPFIENKRFYFTLQKQCLRRKTALECRRLHIPFTDLRNLCASDYVDFYKRGPSCAKVIPCTHSSTEKPAKWQEEPAPGETIPPVCRLRKKVYVLGGEVCRSKRGAREQRGSCRNLRRESGVALASG